MPDGIYKKCLLCQESRPINIAEIYREGVFYRCLECGLMFAEPDVSNIERYYDSVWSDENSSCKPYNEKREVSKRLNTADHLIDSIPRYRWVISELKKLSKGSNILDIGCGEGSILWAAKKLGHTPNGCEVSRNAVKIAKTLVETDNIIAGTLETEIYPNNTFDCVISLEVLEHLRNPRYFIETIAAILKPTGTLLLSTPNYYRGGAFAERMVHKPHSCTDYPPHHYSRWTAKTLKTALKRSFGEIRIGSIEYQASSPFKRIASKVFHALTFKKMGQSLFAVAKKPISYTSK